MKSLLFASLIFLFSVSSCTVKTNADNDAETSAMEGTWELLSETKIENEDTTFTAAAENQRMIKIINKTHFSFLRHDLNQGKDSAAAFVAGGGRYTLEDKTYTEHLEFCNFREWENHTFEFKVDIVNDTLTQQGLEKIEGLGINRIIIEKYKRVKR